MIEETTEGTGSESATTHESPVTFDNLSDTPIESAIDEGQKVDETSDTPSSGAKVQEDNKKGDVETTETEDESDEADETGDEEDSAEADEAEKPDEAEGEKKEKKPPKFVWNKYNKLNAIDEDFLTPLKDTAAVTDADAFMMIAERYPTRAQGIAQEAAKHSVDLYPNDWLQYILGDKQATVETIKAEREGRTVATSDEQLPVKSEFIGISETPEVKEAIKYIESLYGKDWRDSANDDQILEDDLPQVRVLRANLANEQAQKQRFDEMQKKIDDLEPTVKGIEAQQATQTQQTIDTNYQNAVTQYEQSIRSKAMDSVFKAENLLPSDSDDEISKDLKTSISSQFENYSEGMPSRFDDFMNAKFSDREKLGTVIRRVDKAIKDAETIEFQSTREKDSARAKTMKNQAATLRSHAEDESSVLTVMAKQGMKEFINSEAGPLKRALAEIQQLRKQVNGNVRTEVVGGSANGAGERQRITFDSEMTI